MTDLHVRRRADSDDFITWVAKLAAIHDLDPLIVTVGGGRAQTSQIGVLGSGTAMGFSVDDLTNDDASLGFGDGSVAVADFRRRSLIFRFDELSALDRLIRLRPDWIDACVGVITSFPTNETVMGRLEAVGFSDWRAFATPAGGLTVGARAAPDLGKRTLHQTPAHPPLTRLVIVDPCLGAGRGHYLGHARLLSEGAIALERSVVWAANRHLDRQDAPAAVDVRRCFDRCFIDLDRSDLRDIDLSGELLGRWLDLADEFDGPGNHFLLHTADAHMLRATAGFLDARPHCRTPIHIHFHVDPRRLAGRAVHEEVHRTIVRIRRSDAWERRVYVWAENRPLANWLTEWLQAPIPVAPALVRAPLIRPNGEGEELRLSFLGEARASKGFLDLPDIAAEIAKDGELSSAVQLFVQWSPPLGPDLRRHREAAALLRRHPFAKVFEGELSDSAYQEQLAATNIMLFPYDPGAYRLRGSGVLVEALAQGSGLILRAGSALADTAGQGVAFTYRRTDELPRILRHFVAHRGRFAAMALRRAQRFCSLNSPERYIRALDRRARGHPQAGERTAAVGEGS